MSKSSTAGGSTLLASTSTFPGLNNTMMDMDSSSTDVSIIPEYRYQVEISQMMFVFADVVDPIAEVTRLVEDIVRNQVIEMIIQSRRLAQRRGSKYLSPEDLIFLIRYDRAKVNRLRTYLSWKEVRKNAKDSGDSAAGGGGAGAGGDMDGLEDPTSLDGGGGAGMKATKMKIRLPWEISSVYSEHLISIPGADGEEEEDEDDLEAHEDSMQRLKDADEATRRMTREEYVHYSECRQASFTFRKAKRFREFINANAYLDVKPNDDIIDILGFLAFEVVRELCVGAVQIKKNLEEQERLRIKAEQRQAAVAAGGPKASTVASKRKLSSESTAGDSSMEAKREKLEPSTIETAPNGSTGDSSGESGDQTATAQPTESSQAKAYPDSTSYSSSKGSKRDEPSHHDQQQQDHQQDEAPTEQELAKSTDSEYCTLFSLPPSKETPLQPEHIQEAFAKLQRGRAALTTGIRGSGGPGGLRRTRVFVI